MPDVLAAFIRPTAQPMDGTTTLLRLSFSYTFPHNVKPHHQQQQQLTLLFSIIPFLISQFFNDSLTLYHHYHGRNSSTKAYPKSEVLKSSIF
jgi:hypothetical protein